VESRERSEGNVGGAVPCRDSSTGCLGWTVAGAESASHIEESAERTLGGCTNVGGAVPCRDSSTGCLGWTVAARSAPPTLKREEVVELPAVSLMNRRRAATVDLGAWSALNNVLVKLV